MAVIIGGITPLSSATDATSGYQLNGAYGVLTLTLGGTTYVYVAGHDDNGLSAFVLNPDGSLSSIQNISDNSTLELTGASQITSATVGGVTYLYVNSALDDGLSVFRVNSNGTLTNVQNITDDATLELNGPEGKMQVAVVGGTTYLVSPGDDDNGVAVFRINSDGTLTNTYNLTDAGDLQLHSASDSVIVAAGGHTYVYIAGEDDPGISVFELNADGTLTSLQNIHDDAVLELDGTMGLATATVGGTTYVIASGAIDDGLSVFAVGVTGQLTNVFNITDSASLGLDGAMGLSTFTLDTETFVAVSARDEDALSIFHVGADGTLTDVTTIFDGAGVELDGTIYNSFVTVDGTPMLIVSGRYDDGVTVFDIGSGDDALAGTSSADLLMGFAGYDTLDGAGGGDEMIGGSGDDVLEGGAGDDSLEGGEGTDEAVFSGPQAGYDIVLNADGSVTVTHRNGGADGTDRLVGVEWLRFSDGVVSPGGGSANAPPTDITVSGGTIQENSAAGTLVATLGAVDSTPGDSFTFAIDDPSGLFEIEGNTIRVAAGAAIDYEAATSHRVTVTVTDSAGGTREEDLVIQVGNVAPVLTGTDSANTLGGTAEDDTIWGRGGNDTLSGLGGNDTLYGEAGGDRLDGGAGADSLIGGAANDTYVVDNAGDAITEAANQGTDLVQTTLASFTLDTPALAHVENVTFTGSGAFAVTGNGLANALTSGGGNDTLTGGGGNDILKAQGGADTLDGGAGLDDFVYLATGNSTTASRDRILGFVKGEDDIVLTSVDANTGAGGNQAFVLDTNASFSAGEIRQTVSGGSLLLELNTDGDTAVEMAILLEGVTSPLAASDFEL